MEGNCPRKIQHFEHSISFMLDIRGRALREFASFLLGVEMFFCPLSLDIRFVTKMDTPKSEKRRETGSKAIQFACG